MAELILYSEEFKATAVKLSRLAGVRVQDVAQAVDIHPFMLSRWRKEARKVWKNISSGGSFRLHWWLAEYVAGELMLEKREVSDARWLTPDEICKLDGTFEGDRMFFEKVLPSLTA
ncbi:MAG: transposase [Deltaproteobacteria bacterium]|nr:transposase [Deltaproteobacteria bacterium]